MADVSASMEVVKTRQSACTAAKTALANAKASVTTNKTALDKQKLDRLKLDPHPNSGHYTVYRNQDIHLVVDETNTYRVPMNRALIGTTTYSLTFSDGMLTDQTSGHPGSVAEIFSLIETATKGLADFVSEIIPLKIHLAGQQTQLLIKQAELEAKIDDVSSTLEKNTDLQTQITELEDKEELTPTESAQLEVYKLEQEKNLAELNKKIATLNAEIEELKKSGTGAGSSDSEDDDGDKPPASGEDGFDQAPEA